VGARTACARLAAERLDHHARHGVAGAAGQTTSRRASRGRITVDGERYSALRRAISYAGSVLIRESSF
jgi:hypothetical protein